MKLAAQLVLALFVASTVLALPRVKLEIWEAPGCNLPAPRTEVFNNGECQVSEEDQSAFQFTCESDSSTVVTMHMCAPQDCPNNCNLLHINIGPDDCAHVSTLAGKTHYIKARCVPAAGMSVSLWRSAWFSPPPMCQGNPSQTFAVSSDGMCAPIDEGKFGRYYCDGKGTVRFVTGCSDYSCTVGCSSEQWMSGDSCFMLKADPSGEVVSMRVSGCGSPEPQPPRDMGVQIDWWDPNGPSCSDTPIDSLFTQSEQCLLTKDGGHSYFVHCDATRRAYMKMCSSDMCNDQCIEHEFYSPEECELIEHFGQRIGYAAMRCTDVPPPPKEKRVKLIRWLAPGCTGEIEGSDIVKDGECNYVDELGQSFKLVSDDDGSVITAMLCDGMGCSTNCQTVSTRRDTCTSISTKGGIMYMKFFPVPPPTLFVRRWNSTQGNVCNMQPNMAGWVDDGECFELKGLSGAPTPDPRYARFTCLADGKIRLREGCFDNQCSQYCNDFTVIGESCMPVGQKGMVRVSGCQPDDPSIRPKVTVKQWDSNHMGCAGDPMRVVTVESDSCQKADSSHFYAAACPQDPQAPVSVDFCMDSECNANCQSFSYPKEKCIPITYLGPTIGGMSFDCDEDTPPPTEDVKATLTGWLPSKKGCKGSADFSAVVATDTCEYVKSANLYVAVNCKTKTSPILKICPYEGCTSGCSSKTVTSADCLELTYLSQTYGYLMASCDSSNPPPPQPPSGAMTTAAGWVTAAAVGALMAFV